MLEVSDLLFDFDITEDYSYKIAMNLRRDFLNSVETVIDFGNF